MRREGEGAERKKGESGGMELGVMMEGGRKGREYNEGRERRRQGREEGKHWDLKDKEGKMYKIIGGRLDLEN